jgi:peptidyl-prolyl cis-trans isomerase B (cyclophilin B)
MTKQATIETDRGTLEAELFEKDAPKTVENFEKLANSGFYDGTKFHRVIPGFMVQGGDPYSKGGEHAKGPVGTGGPGWKIPCETEGNPHKHEVGALSMAHAGKNTGGSQFFIVLDEGATRHLNGVHTVFGKLTKGVELIPKIAQNDTIKSIRISGGAKANG